MPLFSIVIPTRNRAHRLRFALESVMTQDYDDYEIIVSDNSSSDDTQSMVRGFSHHSLRYVYPPSYLRMHDHWEFARKYACGDYLLFLGDDDCLAKSALSTFAKIIKTNAPLLIGCRSIDYYSDDYWIRPQRNYIRIEPYSGRLVNVDAYKALGECFRFNPHPYYYPRVTIPIARSLVEMIASRVGRFFDYPYPEYVGLAMIYAMIDCYSFLDKPLVVLGRTSDSLGPRYFWSNQDCSWQEMTGQPFTFVPLKGTYMTNGAAESFLRAKNNLPDRFQGIELSWVNYYNNYYRDMLTQRGLGRNINIDLDEFYSVVGSLELELRTQIHRVIKDVDLRRSGWHKLLRKTRSLILRAKQLTFHSTFSDKNDIEGSRWIDGNKIGVTDILSCVRWLENQTAETYVR